MTYDAVIVGAGFSGALLGRILARGGWRVLLVDRQRHPRFALGESTTPLANLSLERLGRRYDLPELVALAAHGRWKRAFPDVTCGLKRGFSFYAHRPGRRWKSDATNEHRLLVAASPDDEIADSHWLRAEVDRLFATLAVSDGAELLEGVEIDSIEGEAGRWSVSLRDGMRARSVLGRLLIDASGAGGAVVRRLGIGPGPRLKTASGLVYGHFRNVAPLESVLSAACRRQAPYAEEHAAVHHLLEEGWMYSLRFDDDRVSAGLLVDESGRAGRSEVAESTGAGRCWDEILSRYPTLRDLFRSAEPLREIASLSAVQRRLATAHGAGWAALPHTFGFVDPLFSTGIAWSLRGVERLADLLGSRSPLDRSIVDGRLFEEYSWLLAREIDQVDRLVSTAYGVRDRFDLFASHCLLYFAVVSFAEARERLCDIEKPWWEGLLGADVPEREALFTESSRRLRDVRGGRLSGFGYRSWVARAIEPIDVAGLDRPPYPNVYPVNLETLLERGGKLGLDRASIESALPRLRGG